MNNEERGREALDDLRKALKGRERSERSRPVLIAVAAAATLIIVVGAILFFATRDSSDDVADDADSDEPDTSEVEPLALERAEELPETVTCEYEDDGQEPARDVEAPNGEDVSTDGKVTVTLATNHGDIGLSLDRQLAPCATNAIEHLAKEGFYDDTVCHRMTEGTLNVLQCGDPNGAGTGGPGFKFANEYPTDEILSDEEIANPQGANPEAQRKANSPVVYPKGTIAMANSGPTNNGSQFFLNYEDSQLPPMYTVLGTINDEGLKTLEKISDLGISGDTSDGEPAEEVRIESATVA